MRCFWIKIRVARNFHFEDALMRIILISIMAFILAFAVMLAMPITAQAASESDLTFTLNSDGESYSVTACNTSAVGKLVIPETYNGRPVTGIGVAAFRDCTGLTGITIPDSVTSIGASAFSGCGNLEEMTIPFVGGSQNTADIYGQPNSKIALFGYIFGTEAYEGGHEVKQGFTKYTADGSLTTTKISYIYNYSDSYGGGRLKDSYDLYETLKYYSMPYNYVNYALNPVAKEQKLRALHYVIHKTNEIRDSDLQLRELSAKILWTYGEPQDEYRQAYYIPETLKKVTVTNADRIYFGAFSYCGFIEEIHITKADTKIHRSVFYGTASTTQVFCLKGSALEEYILDGKHISSGARYGGKYISPEKPVILNVTDGTVTLQRSSNVEYSLDGKNWTDSNVFTGLAPDTEYTFYQRRKSKQTKCLMELPNTTTTVVYSVTILESDPSEGVTVTTKPSLSGISISSLPTKLTYVEAKGDLNVQGGKLRLDYGENHFEVINLTADMVQGFNNTQIGPQTLTVTYRGFSATFDILIEKKAVSSISVFTNPAKTTYIEGQEELDVSGGKLRIYYNNDTQEIIYLTPEMVSGFDNTRIGYQYLTVTYAGKTCSFQVYIDAIDYTITFLNWDGSVISTKIYHRGDTVNAPVMPTKTANETYTYAFAGWDKEVVSCDGDATYTATYTPIYREYTIVFKEQYGTIYATQTYHWGDAVIPPADPTKAATNVYTYTFTGWDKEVVPCAGDAVYTAIFTSSYIDYTVIFKDWDGTVLSTNTYHWNDWIIRPENPVREADNISSYDFAGWDKDVITCAGDAVYTATYTPTYIDYTVIFQDWDGSVLSTKTYHWGDEVVAPTIPTKVADNTYTYAFARWDKTVGNCVGDATYTATYTKEHIDYTVEFKNWDGAVLSTKTYHWGDTVTVPTNPTKAADNTYTYAFAGWDSPVVNCAGDATYTATYTPSHIVHEDVIGDYTGDGQITNEDVIHLLWFTVFPEDYPINGKADFTGDGEITNEDVIHLLWFTVFPEDYPLSKSTTNRGKWQKDPPFLGAMQF